MDYQKAFTNPDAHSAEQRRPPDSYGKSGKGETLQACRSGSPQSHVSQATPAEEKALLHPYLMKKWVTGKRSPIQMHTVQ
ncbi:hypothetical protein BACI349Y_290030 [Bacillus sp. 349Y]|nr:hypothetical protein BACI349Y_290030 [Bacillus sp. 349Y]